MKCLISHPRLLLFFEARKEEKCSLSIDCPVLLAVKSVVVFDPSIEDPGEEFLFPQYLSLQERSGLPRTLVGQCDGEQQYEMVLVSWSVPYRSQSTEIGTYLCRLSFSIL